MVWLVGSALIDRRTARLAVGLAVAGSLMLTAGLGIWAVSALSHAIPHSAHTMAWLAAVALLTAGVCCGVLMIVVLLGSGATGRAAAPAEPSWQDDAAAGRAHRGRCRRGLRWLARRGRARGCPLARRPAPPQPQPPGPDAPPDPGLLRPGPGSWWAAGPRLAWSSPPPRRSPRAPGQCWTCGPSRARGWGPDRRTGQPAPNCPRMPSPRWATGRHPGPGTAPMAGRSWRTGRIRQVRSATAMGSRPMSGPGRRTVRSRRRMAGPARMTGCGPGRCSGRVAGRYRMPAMGCRPGGRRLDYAGCRAGRPG